MSFPSNPTPGQEHEENGVLFRWDPNLFGPGFGGWVRVTQPGGGGGGIPEPPNDNQLHARRRPVTGSGVWDLLPAGVTTDDGVF